MLDAVDPVKPAVIGNCPTAVNMAAREEPGPSAILSFSRSLAPVADEESDGALEPICQGPYRAHSTEERVNGRSDKCKRPRLRADKDLAQKLLFSEDLEEAEHAQKALENTHSSPTSACINGLSCQERKHSPQVGSSTK